MTRFKASRARRTSSSGTSSSSAPEAEAGAEEGGSDLTASACLRQAERAALDASSKAHTRPAPAPVADAEEEGDEEDEEEEEEAEILASSAAHACARSSWSCKEPSAWSSCSCRATAAPPGSSAARLELSQPQSGSAASSP